MGCGLSKKEEEDLQTFEDESKLPLVDGEFDEVKVKFAFFAVHEEMRNNKTEANRRRRGSLTTALYSTEALSKALSKLGFGCAPYIRLHVIVHPCVRCTYKIDAVLTVMSCTRATAQI